MSESEVDPPTEVATERGSSQPRRKLDRRKLWLFGAAASALSLVVALAALEILARLLVQNAYGTIEDLRRFQEVKRSGRQMTLIHLVRPGSSENKRLVYEMVPGVDGQFFGAPVSINSSGFFDRKRAVEKPAGTFRIAALGDSVLFGWGVSMEQRFSSLLETFLNDTATTESVSFPGVRYEVLNFGIPGYNTMMEAEILQSHASRYQPDALLLTFVPDNDSRLPNFVVKPKDRLSLRRSYLFEAVRERGLGSLRDQARPELMDAHSREIPEEYRFLDGEEAMVQGLREIREAARQTSLPLFLLPYFCNIDQLDGDGRVTSVAPPTRPEVAALGLAKAEEFGYVTVDPRGRVGRYLGEKRLVWKDLMLAPDRTPPDTHPNLVYHVLLAKELYRSMVEHGALPDSLQRRARLAEDLKRWDAIVEEAWKRLGRS